MPERGKRRLRALRAEVARWTDFRNRAKLELD
jgi:hypothetical protein